MRLTTFLLLIANKDPVWADTYEIIRWLEKIVDQGVAVYTISSNGGRGDGEHFDYFAASLRVKYFL